MTEHEKQSQKSYEETTDIEQLDEIARERHEALSDKLERADKEQGIGSSDKEALIEATELAKEADLKKQEQQTEPTNERKLRGAPSKKQLRASFDTQMKQVQDDLHPGDRLLSKFIHTPFIETASEYIGSTIARPNALFSGSIAAFISITILYFAAKFYGFQLSGFEMIGAFAVGWILGILYDYLAAITHGRRKD